MKIIAHIETDFPEKFGIPRQSGIVEELSGRIVFMPEYRNPDAVKGIEGFDYLWLLWKFEGTEREGFSATVRPPRLGGNQSMGVFATRSPFRPNPIGLSSVRLESVEYTDRGAELIVSGVDLRDRTPIYDIKPYLPYADSHPEAKGGFGADILFEPLDIEIKEEFLTKIPVEKREALLGVLREDPRPGYHQDGDRIYGIGFAGYNIQFIVNNRKLTVTGVDKMEKSYVKK